MMMMMMIMIIIIIITSTIMWHVFDYQLLENTSSSGPWSFSIRGVRKIGMNYVLCMFMYTILAYTIYNTIIIKVMFSPSVRVLLYQLTNFSVKKYSFD